MTWCVHAVKGRDQSVVLQSHVITLLQQTSDVRTVLSLRQQPASKLSCQHLRVELQYGSTQPEVGQRSIYLVYNPPDILPDRICH